jgi:hypothetical protein
MLNDWCKYKALQNNLSCKECSLKKFDLDQRFSFMSRLSTDKIRHWVGGKARDHRYSCHGDITYAYYGLCK